MTDKTADETLVTKVMTFKSGKVAFSRKYRREAVGEDLVRFESLFQALVTLPILPSLAAQLDTDLIRRSIFGTAAIEGNQLSEERVGEILAEPEGKRLHERAEQEIVNLGKAYKQFVRPPANKAGGPFLVTEALIRDINQVITADIAHKDHSPGQYRNGLVKVGNLEHGGEYVPPKIRADIETLMAAFVEWINSEAILKEPCVVRAALAHYHLALLHPFGDGNGRTARLLEAVILTQNGYRYVPVIMSNHYYEKMDDYYIAFREMEKAADNNVAAFLKFFMRVLLLSVGDIQDRIHWHIRILALRHLYAAYMEDKTITRRQHDLLHVLLHHPGKTVVLKEMFLDPLLTPLYRAVSEKTARRDLARLQELKLLLLREERLLLNPFILD